MSALARTTAPQTSHQAAASANTTESQREVLYLLRAYAFGLTDGELEQAHISDYAVLDLIPFSGSRLRTARAELVDQGKVRDLGTTRRTPRGRQSIVWTLTH